MMSDVRFMGFRSDPYSFLNYTDLEIGKGFFSAKSNYGRISAKHIRSGVYEVLNKDRYCRSDPVFRVPAIMERF